MSEAQRERGTDDVVAVIVSQDDAHAFLLECLLHDVDTVVHLDTPQEAIDLVFDGRMPSVVLVDVALYDAEADEAATTAALRIVASEAIVLEIGERLDHSGELLGTCFRGNSLEVREWASLRA